MRATDVQEAVNRGRIKLMKRKRRQRENQRWEAVQPGGREVAAVTAQEGIQSSARAH